MLARNPSNTMVGRKTLTFINSDLIQKSSTESSAGERIWKLKVCWASCTGEKTLLILVKKALVGKKHISLCYLQPHYSTSSTEIALFVLEQWQSPEMKKNICIIETDEYSINMALIRQSLYAIYKIQECHSVTLKPVIFVESVWSDGHSYKHGWALFLFRI